jgi:two-component system chemotaxis sensor kinase CheA
MYLSDIYQQFFKSLVHIFRNSVDHGIENGYERLEHEKPEYGTISCDIKKENNFLVIKISDDGKGIDIEKIKNLAISKGIYTIDEVKQLSEQEILLIIFQDTFSTSETITDISGRGVGLASILAELNKLDGSLNINNNFGNGIEFNFSIPL